MTVIAVREDLSHSERVAWRALQDAAREEYDARYAVWKALRAREQLADSARYLAWKQPREAFYVSVVDGTRRGLLVGPFDTREQALAEVETVRAYVTRWDDRAHFYGFGTARWSGPAGRMPAGRLNSRFGR